tara:strand:- start:4127 stop:4939 length:813 start_codon:yes stop_codon:yes gene_type:complete
MATTARKGKTDVGAATLKQIFPNWEVKERIYVLKRKATPISFQLRSRHTDHRALQWYDKDYGYPRSMRYVTNQSAIFTDEQNEDNLRLGGVLFEDGKLVVEATNTILQQFLALHPDNLANKGGVFFEYDPDAAAREDLAKEMDGFKAVAIAIEMPIEDLEAIARVLFPTRVDSMTSGEIKRDVVMFAKNKPQRFNEVSNNSNIKMVNLATKAISLGLIKIADDNSTVKWAINGKEIIKLPFSKEPIETLAVWMKTNEGIVFMESLINKMT